MSENLNLLDFKDKTCVVTGCSSGMGKALCETLVKLEAKVYGLDRNSTDTVGVTFIETDLSKKESIDEAFKKIPTSIDNFFGVAGLSGAKTSWHVTFTVNFIANKYITEEYLEKRMVKGSSITYVTSTGGLMWEKWEKEYKKVITAKSWEEMEAFMNKTCPNDGVGIMAYSLSKRAMNYYTNYEAVKLASKGIRVNSVLPGSTDTGMKQEFEKMAGGEESLLKENGDIGRLATPSEMADPILFLGSNMARFVSGQLLIVDFGNNSQIILGYKKSKLDVPVASKIYNSKMVQNKLKQQI